MSKPIPPEKQKEFEEYARQLRAPVSVGYEVLNDQDRLDLLPYHHLIDANGKIVYVESMTLKVPPDCGVTIDGPKKPDDHG